MVVIVCAFLASVYLAVDAARRGRPKLVNTFRQGAVAGVIVLHADAPDLFHGLTHHGAPLIVVSAISGASTLVSVGLAPIPSRAIPRRPGGHRGVVGLGDRSVSVDA